MVSNYLPMQKSIESRAWNPHWSQGMDKLLQHQKITQYN